MDIENADRYTKTAGIMQKYEAVDLYWRSSFLEAPAGLLFFQMEGSVMGVVAVGARNVRVASKLNAADSNWK